jgi:hypothetical protein
MKTSCIKAAGHSLDLMSVKEEIRQQIIGALAQAAFSNLRPLAPFSKGDAYYAYD